MERVLTAADLQALDYKKLADGLGDGNGITTVEEMRNLENGPVMTALKLDRASGMASSSI